MVGRCLHIAIRCQPKTKACRLCFLHHFPTSRFVPAPLVPPLKLTVRMHTDSGKSVAQAQMSRVTRLLDAGAVLSASSTVGLPSPDSFNLRETSNRFSNQTFEQFWLYNDPI